MEKAIICDLDNTLFDYGNRDPYDCTNCEQDKIIEHTLLILLGLHRLTNCKVLFITGRLEKYRKQTMKRLYQTIPIAVGWNLYMRAEDDHKPNSEIKKSIYLNKIKGRFEIFFALEDNTKSVNMFRNELNIPCVQ